MRFLRFALIVFSGLLGAFLVAWSAGALFFDLPASPLLRTTASILWVVGAVAFGIFGGLRGRILAIFGFAVIVGWWLSLRPSEHEDWQPQVATLAYANREQDRVTVHDIRNFDYRSATDFTPRYDTRTFDLTNLRALDLFINYWGSPYMAHPILSFDFGPQGHLCFSIEIRPRRGQNYSTLGGLYRQYELIYIAADERDVVRLRTNYKREDIYLYRLLLAPDSSILPFFHFTLCPNSGCAEAHVARILRDRCLSGLFRCNFATPLCIPGVTAGFGRSRLQTG